MTTRKSAVVLGAYGFIGAACVKHLQAAGFRITGAGRSRSAAHQTFPDIPWHILDIANATTEEWPEIFQSADIIINASGALQDSAKDNLEAIHIQAIERICEALKDTDKRFIQISAAGVSPKASTQFFRTKAKGDALIQKHLPQAFILRPALVIGPQAYGGTALLRAASAMPLIGFKVFPDSQIQCISLDDLAKAVTQCALGNIPEGTTADLAEETPQSFWQLTEAIRSWQGFPEWRYSIRTPNWLLTVTSKLADMLGHLGWRSPLRSTSIETLREGICADTSNWKEASGFTCKTLQKTLADLPGSTQERWFARLYLLLPLTIACLSLFWLASGIIGGIQLNEAQSVLLERGFPPTLALLFVLGGSLADITLGTLILFRKHTRFACLGMIGVTLSYLGAGTIWATDLWADPLGPYVKTIPTMILALFPILLMEER
ncbi:SDR family oxidoreductase [Pseudovibrio brasiliensis]|uniref:SDR family oxidoreductase n=1 Tax=Pseudovibrio brasiliensis TaxID=1898042 RepID=A0ABX8AHS8_9HYPH|nr:SDR family oxidoreductase [Pseudovibrio brasiliensis]QUS54574.1 SDR family oxidoreductase [Pseudovibrio brasiliensis]